MYKYREAQKRKKRDPVLREALPSWNLRSQFAGLQNDEEEKEGEMQEEAQHHVASSSQHPQPASQGSAAKGRAGLGWGGHEAGMRCGGGHGPTETSPRCATSVQDKDGIRPLSSGNPTLRAEGRKKRERGGGGGRQL